MSKQARQFRVTYPVPSGMAAVVTITGGGYREAEAAALAVVKAETGYEATKVVELSEWQTPNFEAVI